MNRRKFITGLLCLPFARFVKPAKPCSPVVIFTKEKMITDLFDEEQIRAICYAFGIPPQKLMKMRKMNHASAREMIIDIEKCFADSWEKYRIAGTEAYAFPDPRESDG
jgi:hypothetical protein